MKVLLFALAIIMALLFTTSEAQNNPADYVAAHKTARAAVGVAPLVWDTTLAAYAQAYANKRAADCSKVRSGAKNYGENILVGVGWGTNWFTGVYAVNAWAQEKANYDYTSNTCKGGECKDYTQVVWKNSKSLGCARVVCNNGGVFVTCNYSPPGNQPGQKPY